MWALSGNSSTKCPLLDEPTSCLLLPTSESAPTSRSLALPPGTSFRANKQRIRRPTRKPKSFEGAAWWRGWPAGWARADGKLPSRQVHPNPESCFHDAPRLNFGSLTARRPARHSPVRRPQGGKRLPERRRAPQGTLTESEK